MFNLTQQVQNADVAFILEAALFFIFTNLASEVVKYGVVKVLSKIDSLNHTFLD